MAELARLWERRWDDLLKGQGSDPRLLVSYWASNEGKLELKKYELKLLEWAENFGV